MKPALVLLACLAAIQAHAQKPDPFDLEVGSVILLQNKSVQKELKVTDKQRASMNKFADAHRAQLLKYQKELEAKQKDKTKPLPVDTKRMDAMFGDMKSGVMGQLTAVQARRLREISLQQLGFVALTDESVAKRVGMSAADQKKVKDAYNAGLKEADQIAQGAQAQLEIQLQDLKKRKPKDDKEQKAIMKEAEAKAEALRKKVDPQIEKVQAKTRDTVLSLLTPAQRAAWKKLLGTPFKGS